LLFFHFSIPPEKRKEKGGEKKKRGKARPAYWGGKRGGEKGKDGNIFYLHLTIIKRKVRGKKKKKVLNSTGGGEGGKRVASFTPTFNTLRMAGRGGKGRERGEEASP